MSNPTGDDEVRGIALLCGIDGIVRRVLRDDIGTSSANLVGHPMTALVDDSSCEKARLFLAEALTSDAAFDWELGIPIGGSVRLFHFAAARAEDGEVVVVAAATRTAVLRYYDELMQINNEQANALRAAIKRVAISEPPTREADVYDQMMALNNELATVQRELTRKNVELQRANSLKNQFVGMAAHDLRNPIGAIRSFGMLLLDEEMPLPPEKRREFLRRIVASTEFMLALINDLLDLSVIESGQLRLDAREVDVVELVRASVELASLLAEEKQIRILLEVAANVSCVIADGRKVEQVLQNLLTNAVKFSPFETTIRVEVRPDAGGVLVAVRDEGPGISPTEIATLFNPFQRATPRGTAGERSTGLGLAIAKRVMDGHGGRLWCESQVGAGSTFLAWLPARQ